MGCGSELPATNFDTLLGKTQTSTGCKSSAWVSSPCFKRSPLISCVEQQGGGQNGGVGRGVKAKNKRKGVESLPIVMAILHHF